ncbi:MAG: BatA domain-containing protein [Anaerolineales bacterium]|nr:BatA domain-containing protein [Anaerolineales bacterium]
MNFLAPAAFAFTLLIPLVIAMYLLKLRRTEQVVSSVYLWQRMVRDLEANAPWQRLRRNLLLFLQLLFLVAVIIAIARPFTWAEGASGQAVIVILDNSASMNANDVSPSRLEAAKTRARQLVNSLPEDAAVTVITTGQNANVLVSSSQDRRQVLQAIDSIQAGTSSSDMTTALQLAAAIAARQTDVDVIVLSDGRSTFPEMLSIKARLNYLPFGLSGENQAISLLNVGQAPGKGSLTAFAQITNYADTSAQRRLEFYADGFLINVFDLEIPPNDQVSILAEDLSSETKIVEARLTKPGCLEPCIADALPLDDIAWAVNRSGVPARLALVTEGNLFLEVAFNLLPNLDVTYFTANEYESHLASTLEGTPTITEPFDLIVFDNYIPTSLQLPPASENGVENRDNTAIPSPSINELPPGNLLFIAPPRSTSIFTVTGALDGPFPRPVDLEDPLLAHVNLAGVNILTAARIPLPDWARNIIAGDSDETSFPLLFAGEIDTRRLAVLSFDLHHSDLPLQIAFPLLISNLTGWLAPGKGADLATEISPGTPVSLTLPLGVESAFLTRPDGSRVRITADEERLIFAETNQLGVYEVTWEGSESMYFSVNLFSPQESEIKPVDNLQIFGIDSTDGEGQTGLARREWWRPLIFFALGIVLIEWLVYHRATLFRLGSKIKPYFSQLPIGNRE